MLLSTFSEFDRLMPEGKSLQYFRFFIWLRAAHPNILASHHGYFEEQYVEYIETQRLIDGKTEFYTKGQVSSIDHVMYVHSTSERWRID